MTEHRPDFAVLCDHGGSGEADPVCRYEWVDEQGVWVARGASITVWDRARNAWVPGESVVVTDLAGDARGWWHPNADGELAFPGPLRTHREFVCPRELPSRATHRDGHFCTRRRYRADDDHVQTVLSMIATNPKFRAVALTVEDHEISVATGGLVLAHELLKRQYGFFR